MTPVEAILGASGAMNAGMGQTPAPMAGGPLGAFQGLMQRARQMAGCFQNPEQLVRQYFPDAPAEVTRDPEQLVGWLQQTGRVSPQMVQTARQMMGGR